MLQSNNGQEIKGLIRRVRENMNKEGGQVEDCQKRTLRGGEKMCNKVLPREA